MVAAAKPPQPKINEIASAESRKSFKKFTALYKIKNISRNLLMLIFYIQF
ncbi:hypothetical protein ACFP3I_16200 [Chryseobacterium arachidis]